MEQLNTGKNISLKFDLTQSESLVKNQEVETMFRIMYWAAYLGKEDIVERIIRLGYSPFVRSYEKKNGLMAAIDGKRINIVEKILSFNYIPVHTSRFEHSRLSWDLYGNNALHLAYKNGIGNEVEKLLSGSQDGPDLLNKL